MSERAKVLVVDDEDVVRRSHTRILASDACQVESVLNGEEALRVMQNQRFDLVLLDVRMPGMDGMSVLRTIKARWPESEVIVITGYPEIQSAKEAVKLGAFDYLAKPVGPDEVINAVNGAMTHKRWALRMERANTDRRSSNTNVTTQAYGC